MKSKLLMVLAAFALLLSAPLAAQVPEDTTNELQQEHRDPVDVDAEIEADGDLDVEAEIDGEADLSQDDDALIEDEPEYDDDADARELPRTASPLPLLALLGAGSLVSALGLRIRRK